MHFLKRLFTPRQKQISPDNLARNIHEFSVMISPRLWGGKRGMIETINAADEKKMTILSNREVAGFLKNRKPTDECGLIWTGTLIIFEEAGRKFGSGIECCLGMYDSSSINFRIPKDFQGLQGGCLVIHHPYFRLSEGTGNSYELQVVVGKLQHMRGFPVREGRFSVDDFFALPVEGGEIIKESVSLELRPFPYIGLVGRSLSKKEKIYTTDPPTDKMCALVRIQINPQNYVEQVVSVLRNGANRNMIEFAQAWAKEDPNLSKTMKIAGEE